MSQSPCGARCANPRAVHGVPIPVRLLTRLASCKGTRGVHPSWFSQCEHPEHRKNRTIWPEEDASAQRIEETEHLLVNCRGAQIEIDQYRSRTRQTSTNPTLSSDSTPETQPSISPNSSPLETCRPGGFSRLTSPTESQAPEPPINLLELSQTSSLAAFPSTQHTPFTTIAINANTVGASIRSSSLTQTTDISSRADSPVSPCSPETPHTPIPIFTYDTPPRQPITTPVKDPTAMLSSNSQSYDSIPLSDSHTPTVDGGGLGSPWMKVNLEDLGPRIDTPSQEQGMKGRTAETGTTRAKTATTATTETVETAATTKTTEKTAESLQGLDPLAGKGSAEDMDLDDYLEFSSPTPTEANGSAHGGSTQGICYRAEHRDRLAVDDVAEHHSDCHEPGGLEAATEEQLAEELSGSVQSPRHQSQPAPDSEPERAGGQDGVGTSVIREQTSELDDDLLDELLEDVEMEEASRACRSATAEEVDDDKEMERPVQGDEEAGRVWVKHDEEDQTSLGGGDICSPTGCDFQAQEDGPSSGNNGGTLVKAGPPQVTIPFTPSPSIRSDDAPRSPDSQKTSRRLNRQSALKVRPSKYQMKIRGKPYKAAVDRAVLSALKRSVLHERSATASERARRAEEVMRREVAERQVRHVEREKAGWGRERAMLIGEIKRLRGWELSEPTEGAEEHDGAGDGDGGTDGEVGTGLKRTKTRRHTVGDIPPFKPFVPTQTRIIDIRADAGASKSRRKQR